MIDNVKSIVFEGINQVSTHETSELFQIGVSDVLIKTHFSCISAGTELAKLEGLQTIEYPTRIGNRAIGRVLEVGPEVNNIVPGNLVFSYLHHISHSLGVRLVCQLPDALDRPAGATLGMASIALTGVQTAAPEIGDTAVVIGAGLVGQFSAQLLELSGVNTILLDKVEGRLKVAQGCGVSHTVNTSIDDPLAAVLDLTKGNGAEIVLECTGIPLVAAKAPTFSRRSGTVVLVGSPRGEFQSDLTTFLNYFHLWRNNGNLTLKGSHEWKVPLYSDGHAKHSIERNYKILSRLVLEKRLHLDPLVSNIYDPQMSASAYQDLRKNRETVLGTVFDWTLKID